MLTINISVAAVIVKYEPTNWINSRYIILSSSLVNEILRMFILSVTYHVLFSLKNVEVQLNPKYLTVQQIISALKR